MIFFIMHYTNYFSYIHTYYIYIYNLFYNIARILLYMYYYLFLYLLQVLTENRVPAGGQHSKSVEPDHGTMFEPRRQTDAKPIVK